MINAAAFVIGFVLIGLSVVLIAMRGGPRGARQAMHTQSARGRTTASLVIAGISLAFGIAIPAAVLASNTDGDRSGPGGVKLSAGETRGRLLFVKTCGNCHTLGGAGTYGKIGPNLDNLRPPKALVLNAIDMGRARGNGQMPAQLLLGQDARNVATFIARVAGR